jgi:WD40 repeat protein
VRLWDLSEPKPHAEVLDGPGGGSVRSVAFTHGGATLLAATHVAAGDRAMVIRWDLATRRPRQTFHGESHIYCLAAAPDGRTFVTGCQNGTSWVWDAEQLSPSWPFPPGRGFVTAAYSANGQTLVTSGGWGNPVRLWRGRPPAD